MRMDRVPNARIKELCGVKKGLDERIDKGVLRWFGHMERMQRDRISKRVYVGECDGSRSVGRARKRWINTVKECLKKRGWMSGKQGEWWVLAKGNFRHSPGWKSKGDKTLRGG